MFLLQTAIHSRLLSKALFKGLFIAFIGLILLWTLYYGLHQEMFNTMGFFAWFLSIILIAIGLIPYKRKKALELSPEVMIVDDEKIELLKKGKVHTKIFWKDVISYHYEETKNTYGIYFLCTKKRTFFFEYFTKRSFDKLSEWHKTNHRKKLY